MSDSASPTAFTAPVPAPSRVVAAAFLWMVGSLLTALAIYALVVLIAAHHQREVGRVASDVSSAGYVAALVGAFATRHGFPSQQR